MIFMAGGCHDAGDLSQSYWQTASATAAFFRLAMQYMKDNKKLSDRLIQEGLWGQPAFRMIQLIYYLYE